MTGKVNAFMYAVLYLDAPALAKLIEKGADVNHANDSNVTPLMWAVNDLAKTRLLMEHGSAVNARSNDGRTPVFIAATQPGAAPIVKFHLDHGAYANPANRAPGDSTPLRQAAVAGDAEVMRLLIQHGASIKEIGAAGLSATIEADCEKCFELIGESFDAKTWTTALLDMAVVANPKDMKFALDHGADPNTRNVKGRTPLMFAANSDLMRFDTVKLLIEKGANLNEKDLDGETALDLARLRGNTPIVDLLLKFGAKGAPFSSPPLQFVEGNNTIQAAVDRSLPIIQKSDVNFMEKAGCFSCHNQGLAAMAVGTVRRKGFAVDEKLAALETKYVSEFFGSWRERLLQGMAPGGSAYSLVGLHEEQYKPDLTSDAVASRVLAAAARVHRCVAPKSPTPLSRCAACSSMRPMPIGPVTRSRFSLPRIGSPKRSRIRMRTVRIASSGWRGQAAIRTPSARPGLNCWRQLQDGSWFQKRRALPVQPYFDNGFPHGDDQWISVAATNWAVMALALAAPNPGTKPTGF